MKYFFDKWYDFSGAMRRKPNILLLLDFDGTLTPIVSEPKKAVLSPAMRGYLKKLADLKRVSTAVISGRGLKNIMALVGVKGLYYSGNHGLEVKGPKGSFVHPDFNHYKPSIEEIAKILKRRLAGIKGVILEHKKFSLGVHYRMVAKKSVARVKKIVKEVTDPYIEGGKVKITTGKKVLEVRPPIIWHKGDAVDVIEKMVGKKDMLKIFIGDDVTDEDAFEVLGNEDFPIRVGKRQLSKAKYFLKNPDEVRRFLVKMIRVMPLVVVMLSFALLSFVSYVSAAEIAASPEADVVVEQVQEEATGVAEGETAEEPKAKTGMEKIVTMPAKAMEGMTRVVAPSRRTGVKIYNVKTEDNWEISMNRYTVKDKSVKPKAAVILCHGFNINNIFWDVDERCSLARYLAANGYDVWVPSLRGSGRSSKPMLSKIRSIAKFDFADVPRALVRAPFDMTKFTWTIDDHIHKDVPAIIKYVKKESGFEKVYWIGHSMGGIVMFGYLETEDQRSIAGFIPIASMITMRDPLTPHLQRIANQKQILTASLIVNTTVASQVRNVTLGTVKNPIEGLLFETANMYQDVLFRFFRTCIDDTSAGVVSQFSDSIRQGAMLSRDGSYSYTENLDRIWVPICIMAGSKDGFVNDQVVQKTYNAVSSRDKKKIIFSKANGYTTDYGHCDLIIGKNSEQDLYPEILTWLDERAVKKVGRAIDY